MAQKENGDAAVTATTTIPRAEVHYRGVRKIRGRRYAAEIRDPCKKKNVWLGTFDTREQAATAYDAAARLFHGHKAVTNFPPVIDDNIQNVKKFLEKLNERSAIGPSSRAGSNVVRSVPLPNENPQPVNGSFVPLPTARGEYCLETMDFIGSWCGVQGDQLPAITKAEPLNLDLSLAPPGSI